MGIDGKNVVTCMSCKNTREKEGMTHIIDLMYPRKVRPPLNVGDFSLDYLIANEQRATNSYRIWRDPAELTPAKHFA